uniref:Ectonucleotide pyrophosphatase/phosphodiesterase 1 n=1 Tax=Takifugu rubripes TaxID=31033 RepID=H2V879_TAKRU
MLISSSGGELWLQQTDEEIQQPQCPSGFSKPPLILVSLDGFRAEYLKDHRSHIPVINKLRKAGTTTAHLRPVYPTKTFPNHYTIVTGLYPESHGIVDNKMYDVSRNAFFSLKTEEKFNSKWYQGEPIWVTAMRQKLKTATFFWPGSDVAINGTFPNLYKKYDRSVSFEDRVATLFDWLSLPEDQRPDFYTLYLEEPDASGHKYGPTSSEVVSALKKVDGILGILMDGLIQRGLLRCVNVIVVSDHGMEEASCERGVFVSNYLENTDDFNLIQGPAARIRPTRLPENYFSCEFPCTCRTANQVMTPYLKENLPKRLHFAYNNRIERGHLYMKSGWQAANRKEVKYCTGGFHGSDNLFTNMQAIFLGHGPGFKYNTVVEPFENIEIYNLMCDLLGIRPAPNNGSHGSLNHLLRRPVHLPVHPAQLSHDSQCEANSSIPAPHPPCACSFRTQEMVRVDPGRRTFSLVQGGTKATLLLQAGVTFCLLHHVDYLNGYSRDRLMPLWVSYTIQPVVSSATRILELLNCPFRCLDLSVLGSPTDSKITSNVAPMFSAFTDVWNHIHDVLLPKYSQELNGVNIMSGPIFDKDFDGNVDPLEAISDLVPLPSRNGALGSPTHFFIILTSCRNPTFSPVDCVGPLRVRSFVLPHREDHTESCAMGSGLTWVEDWLQLHVSRVRDIELLTGLSFYHDRLSVEETLELKTFIHSAQNH